jgi:hypothetical protein
VPEFIPEYEAGVTALKKEKRAEKKSKRRA